MAVIAGGPAGAGAATTSDPVAAARAAVDEVAVRWFAAQAEADAIEEKLAAVEQRVAAVEADVAATREVATARALQIYKGNGTTFVALLGSNDALESARRAELIDRANADSDAAIDELAAVTEDLRSEQADLRDARAHQADVLAGLDAQRSDLEIALDEAVAANAAAGARRTAEAGRGAFGRSAVPAEVLDGAATVSATTPVGGSNSSEPAGGAGGATGSDPAPATGVHPRHDEPFLACTRARESGGSYAAVNPAGYYGAYQFAPLTWNTTASHAGRLELVDVLPSNASAYDQDDLAWVLYQWQGNAPWGGRC